jgi:transcriptional regulator with XRE-family HTH domain
LRLVKGSHATVAAKLGTTTRQAVAQWRQGKKSPSDDNRIALENLYGIARRSWDAYTPDVPANTVADVPAPPSNTNALDELRAQRARYQKLVESLESFGDTMSRTYLAALNGQSAAVARLARIENEESEVRKRVIAELLERIGPVLDRHPGVAAEVHRALAE